MSNKKLVNSQLSNFLTYQMYLRQLLTLAENVFEFKNLPKYIDVAFLNSTLLRKGSIAFFYEEGLDSVVALPYKPLGKKDIYGRPTEIEVSSNNGYRRKLKDGEFVIMYDNNGRYPLWLDICQYAERIALDTRTIDINISQQKTPRIFKTSTENAESVKALLNNIDGYENSVVTYENMVLDDTSVVLAPAPYVADKIDLHKDKDWAEFLRLVGIANMSFQKKERNISDEITAMQGGTIASRYSRFEPRKRAIDEINEKFADYLDDEIDVSYYDGEPTTVEKESDCDVSNISDDSDVSDDE